jgi:hypothetical protein
VLTSITFPSSVNRVPLSFFSPSSVHVPTKRLFEAAEEDVLDGALMFFPGEEATLAFAEESVLLQAVAISATSASATTSGVIFGVFILQSPVFVDRADY